MKIAFTSYEYPPETGGGGIGTYLFHIAPALISFGHKVVIFCGTSQSSPFWENSFVYRIPCVGTDSFNSVLLKHFYDMHRSINFDIVEATDFKGWGLPIKKALPDIPFVVKLHTPSFLVDSLQFTPLSLSQKIRYAFGSLRRFKLPKYPKKPHKVQYSEEHDILRLANNLITTTEAIASKMLEMNMITSHTNIDHVPYAIPINESILKITSKRALKTPQIVFIGRHEVRKGVIELAGAIPLVLKKYPSAHFTFVGNSATSPKKGVDMINYLKKKTCKNHSSVTFTGPVDYKLVASYLNLGDIFVFPSHYESFGLVCTEAMAAGKAVVGSENGGMVEILKYGECGLLTSSNSNEIAKNILKLIEDDDLRIALGEKARERIIQNYSFEVIIPKQIESYLNTIRQQLSEKL